MIAGLNYNGYEFYHDNGKIFLLHAGKNYTWDEIPTRIFNVIEKAYNLAENTVLRNHIETSINKKEERLKEFCRIAWGQLDNVPDISENFEFNFESKEDFALTPREVEFIKLLCRDLADKEIAYKMDVAYNTATTFRQNIENKLGIKSKVGIAVWAIRNGIV